MAMYTFYLVKWYYGQCITTKVEGSYLLKYLLKQFSSTRAIIK
jgi:hypothetical protein